MNRIIYIIIFIIIYIIIYKSPVLSAQISPGDLSQFHENLEGLSNCTKCHVLGNKIDGVKCLECHKEIDTKVKSGKGYHSSSSVKGKQCIECHSDHHGKKFRLINMDTTTFDHNLTGYSLSEPHSKQGCNDCHNTKYITDETARKKKFTMLGLNTECLSCHSDFHQGTLASSCLDCHSPNSFKTAPRFDHDKARFSLAGKHKTADCIKCHKIETVNGAKIQEFRGLAFTSCKNCHADPHKNKFGQDCRKCHTEQSFTSIKGLGNFDHSKTNYPLEGMHLKVECTSCHKERLTSALKYNRCTDCHSDYHKGQLVKKSRSPDCSECHSVKGFKSSSYTIDQHKTVFPLNGSHAAQPCNDCHMKKGSWIFRLAGRECNDCHQDIHKGSIEPKFYPDGNCISCHNESSWREVTFNHSITSFAITGAHEKLECSECHVTKTDKNLRVQKFAGLPSNCISCHNDIHRGQFVDRNCSDCHVTLSWRPEKFDHDKTAFRLDGEHVKVACAKCHIKQEIDDKPFMYYKIKDHRCESCHF